METNYVGARRHIKTGDLIAVRGTGLFAAAIRTITQDPRTHTGVAIWLGNRLMVAETRGGVAAFSPLSQHARHAIEVYDCPVSRPAAHQAALELLGHEIRYDVFDLVALAAHELLGVSLPPEDGEMICSAVTYAIYRNCGWSPAGMPSIPTPRDIVRAIGYPPKLVIN